LALHWRPCPFWLGHGARAVCCRGPEMKSPAPSYRGHHCSLSRRRAARGGPSPAPLRGLSRCAGRERGLTPTATLPRPAGPEVGARCRGLRSAAEQPRCRRGGNALSPKGSSTPALWAGAVSERFSQGRFSVLVFGGNRPRLQPWFRGVPPRGENPSTKPSNHKQASNPKRPSDRNARANATPRPSPGASCRAQSAQRAHRSA